MFLRRVYTLEDVQVRPCKHSNPVKAPQTRSPPTIVTRELVKEAETWYQDITASLQNPLYPYGSDQKCSRECTVNSYKWWHGLRRLLEEQLNPVDDSINSPSNQAWIAAIRKANAPWFQQQSRRYNYSQRKAMPEVGLKMIYMDDGWEPTMPPHNLPALYLRSDIRSLSEHEVKMYEAGYGLKTAPSDTLNIRKRRILGSLCGVGHYSDCKSLPALGR